jgi:hypothetical protein
VSKIQHSELAKIVSFATIIFFLTDFIEKAEIKRSGSEGGGMKD